jgi:dATP pyrophosphohydrolase
MGRAPFQVLVFPYRPTRDGDWEFAIFRRMDGGFWQGISGGGEGDETPLETARRELFEEAGILPTAPFLCLDTTASIRVTWFRESHLWGEDRYVVPEHAFGVRTGFDAVVLSAEHTEMRWLPFEAAEQLLRFDSNRTALWELNLRIRGWGPRAMEDT